MSDSQPIQPIHAAESTKPEVTEPEPTESEASKHQSRTILENWIKSSSKFWENMAEEWTDRMAEMPSPDKSAAKLANAWFSTMKTMQSMASTVSEPRKMELISDGVNPMPELFVKMMAPAWKSFFNLQKDFFARSTRVGESALSYNFGNLDKEAFKVFTDMYEKEFRRLLLVPPLGLTRVYQERMSHAADRFNLFQGDVSEFLAQLFLPIEKSMKIMQEELAAMADTGNLPGNSKAYYQIWLKILENSYMTLFKSPEYTKTLSKTLDSLAEFSVARQEMLYDYLQFLPIPTDRDMDELYKEIYLLKKRIKDLEKQSKSKVKETNKLFVKKSKPRN